MIKAANSPDFAGRMKKLNLTLKPMGQKAFAAKLERSNANIVDIMKKAGMYKSKMKK